MQWAPPQTATHDLALDLSARLATPLARENARDDTEPSDGARGALEPYRTHRSFQRRFNCALNHMRPGENVMCLGLAHPLMPETVRSAMFDKTALLAAAAAGTRIPLARDVGFVLPVARDAGLFLTLFLNTEYISLVVVQSLVDWDARLRL